MGEVVVKKIPYTKESNTKYVADVSALVKDYNDRKFDAKVDQIIISETRYKVSNVPANTKVTTQYERDNTNPRELSYMSSSYTSSVEKKDKNYSILILSEVIKRYKTQNNKTYMTLTPTDHFSILNVAHAPTTRDLVQGDGYTLSSTNIDEDITVTLNTTDSIYLKLDIINSDGSLTNKINKISSNNKIIIPRGTIPTPTTNVRLKIGPAMKLEMLKGEAIDGVFDVQYTFDKNDWDYNKPVISNLIKVGDLWDRDVEFSWASSYQEGYEYELYYNNAKIKHDTISSTGKRFIVPGNTFKGTLQSRAKVRVYRLINGTKFYSNWAEITFNLKDIVPSISYLSVDAKNIDFNIPVTWTSDKQSKWRLEVIQSGAVKNTFSGTNQKQYIIPSNSIDFYGQAIFKLYVAYTDSNGKDSWVNKDVVVTLDRIVPTVSNVLNSVDLWEQPIRVTWQSSNQSLYKLEVLKNNVVVRTYTGTTNKYHDIAAEQLSSGQHTFRVTVAYNGSAGESWSSAALRNANLVDIVATISDLIVDGKYWEKPINLSWRATNNQQFRVEAWKNNVKLHEFIGTTATSFSIPANTLDAGNWVLYVWVAYKNRFVNNQSSRITLVDTVPTVSNLSLSGSNVDLPLNLSWLSENQSVFELIITNPDSTTRKIEGTTEKRVSFPPSTLQVGSNLFTLKVGYRPTIGDIRWSEPIKLSSLLVETTPSIGLLQPDGQLLKKEDAIKVYWESANQTKWSLKIGHEVTANGTFEKQYIVPAGTLTVGSKDLTLTVTYVTQAGVEKKVEKRTKFLVTGKPSTPTIISPSEFSVNRPLIIWDATDQEGYKLDIYDNNNNLAWTSKWISGLSQRQKVMNYLPNGNYRLSLQIMNSFSELSDVSVAEFIINSTVAIDIDLNISSAVKCNNLTWDNKNAEFDKFYIMRNDIPIALIDSQTINEYVDCTFASKRNVYVIRGIVDEDTYKDSNIAAISNDIESNMIAILSNPSDTIQCDKVRSGGNIRFNHSIGNQLVHLTGRRLPVSINNGFSDHQIILEFVSDNALKMVDLIESRDVFIYRERSGGVYYCSVPSINNTLSFTDNQLNVTLNEIDYKEMVDYD